MEYWVQKIHTSFTNMVNNFNNIEILNDETNRKYLIVKTLLANLDPVIQFYGTIF